MYSGDSDNLKLQTEPDAHIQEKPGILITLIVIGLPFVPLIVVLCLNPDILTASYLIEPKYDEFNDYSNIFFGLLFISISLQDLITTKAKVLRQIISLSSIIFGLIGMAMLFIYSSHMTEVVS